MKESDIIKYWAKLVESEGSNQLIEAEDKIPEPDGEWKKCQKIPGYKVILYIPKDGTKFKNTLEDADYKTSNENRYVLIGTVGEAWVPKAKKIISGYTYNKKPITEQILKGFQPETIYILESSDKTENWCKFVPANTEFTVDCYGTELKGNSKKSTKPDPEKTFPGIQIPEDLRRAMNSNFKGGHGAGDYIFANDDNGKPGPEGEHWIVNGNVFKNTYRLR